MSGTGSRRDAGFTLVEALVAVALSGMIAALMFPNLERGLARLSLRMTTATLTAELHAARAAAVRAGAPVSFEIAASGRTYAWTGGPAIEASAPVRLAMIRQDPIVFYADGTTSGGAIAARSGGRAVEIDVDPATGAIVRTGA
jgi:general secretion pathway protein H